MTSDYPLYTEKRECQDCYKCVRHCPVKAISVQDGSALVSHELCIYCGRCYEICPVGAKKVPREIDRAEQIIGLKESVIYPSAPPFSRNTAGGKRKFCVFFTGKG